MLLLIGVSIFNVSLRELAISQSAKDSQLAFYAADSARECALYWDIKKAAFTFCLSDGCGTKNTGLAEIKCNENTINLSSPTISGNTYTYNFSPFFKYGNADDQVLPMADLILTKKFVTQVSGLIGGLGDVVSTLNIQGHNTGSSGRRVERGIYQTY